MCNRYNKLLFFLYSKVHFKQVSINIILINVSTVKNKES